MRPVEGMCVEQISGCHGPNAVYCFAVVKAAASNSVLGRTIFLFVGLHWLFPDGQN